MLKRLLIQNLVTIEKQVIEFGPGLNIITGESGAGKSVIFKAIKLLMGEKSTKNLFANPDKPLLIEGTFETAQESYPCLDQLGIPQENPLVLRRTITTEGKNIVMINDCSANTHYLAELTDDLIDFHGQHANQQLLSNAKHIDYLDNFAQLMPSRKAYTKLFNELQEKLKLQAEFTKNLQEREKKLDFLRFQVEEIDTAQLQENEDLELQQEFDELQYQQTIIETLGSISNWGELEHSPLEELNCSAVALQKLEKHALKINPAIHSFQEGALLIKEAVLDFQSFLQNLDDDPQRLESINERLAEIEKLKKKYGATIQEIKDYQQQIELEIQTLENQVELSSNNQEEITALQKKLTQQAQKLSKNRQKAIPEFSKQVTEKLIKLGFNQVKFQITCNQNELNNRGYDQVIFEIATNPGKPPVSISKIASGGELSRIMLAIKTIEQNSDTIKIIIFDEIDTGVSGKLADNIGQNIKQITLSKQQQVICITHLHQIAKQADYHWLVQKKLHKKTHHTEIKLLDDEAKINELASLIGGENITESAYSTAKELLAQQKQ